MPGLFYPHLRVQAVAELTPERLVALGMDALLLDVDCTLKCYSERQCGPDVVTWIESVRDAGVGLCLVSNGGGRRIREVAEHLGLPYIAKALKPFPFRIRSLVRRMGFEPARTAMVGDQIFADVMAGRLAGLWTILVEPIHPEQEPWITRLKRRPEKILLRRLERLTDNK